MSHVLPICPAPSTCSVADALDYRLASRGLDSDGLAQAALEIPVSDRVEDVSSEVQLPFRIARGVGSLPWGWRRITTYSNADSASGSCLEGAALGQNFATCTPEETMQGGATGEYVESCVGE